MSDAWKSGIAFSQLTDIGMRRANNQDSMLSLPARSPERFSHRGHLFVVADGMGAHAAGELASRLATEHIAMEYFRSTHVDNAEALRMAVSGSNAEIYRRGQQNPEFHNMGTTAVSLAISPQGALVGHVGDSRVYRLRNGQFEQLTFDHSLVWEFEAGGHVHPDSSLGQSIPKNVITRSLGPNENVDVDIEGPFPLQSGDQFLLCSDGLSGQVEDEEIATLMDCLPEDLATRVLVDLANLRGGPDNSTVIIVRVEPEFNKIASIKPAEKEEDMKQEAGVSPLLVLTSIVCLVGAGGLGVGQMYGPMLIAIVLGLIAGVVCLGQFFQSQPKKQGKVAPSVKRSGGKAPYRNYQSKPDRELFERLGKTVDELREAANERNWLMDWSKIDKLQKKGADALEAREAKQAIKYQAKAIIETMAQLRELNNRAANETAIDR